MALLKKWQNKCAQNERKIHDENSVSKSAIESKSARERDSMSVCEQWNIITVVLS